MADKIPYLTKTGALKSYLEKIQKIGTPPKLSIEHLESLGFTSSADRPIISFFKFLGFVDSGGVPTNIWNEYKDTQKAPFILANAVKNAYSDLYEIYPDAHNVDNEAIANFYRSKTGLGDRAIKGIVSSFRILCDMADFSSTTEEIESPETNDQPDVQKEVKRSVQNNLTNFPSLTINIQLTLPVTDKEEIYDKLFSSLRKNLLKPFEKDE